MPPSDHLDNLKAAVEKSDIRAAKSLLEKVDGEEGLNEALPELLAASTRTYQDLVANERQLQSDLLDLLYNNESTFYSLIEINYGAPLAEELKKLKTDNPEAFSKRQDAYRLTMLTDMLANSNNEILQKIKNDIQRDPTLSFSDVKKRHRDELSDVFFKSLQEDAQKNATLKTILDELQAINNQNPNTPLPSLKGEYNRLITEAKTNQGKLWKLLSHPLFNKNTELKVGNATIKTAELQNIRPAGAGSFGEVYSCRYIGHDENVLKLCTVLRDGNGDIVKDDKGPYYYFIMKEPQRNIDGSMDPRNVAEFKKEQRTTHELCQDAIAKQGPIDERQGSNFNLASQAQLVIKEVNEKGESIDSTSPIIISQFEYYEVEKIVHPDERIEYRPLASNALDFLEEAKENDPFGSDKAILMVGFLANAHNSLSALHETSWLHLDIALRNFLMNAKWDEGEIINLIPKVSDYGFIKSLYENNPLVEAILNLPNDQQQIPQLLQLVANYAAETNNKTVETILNDLQQRHSASPPPTYEALKNEALNQIKKAINDETLKAGILEKIDSGPIFWLSQSRLKHTHIHKEDDLYAFKIAIFEAIALDLNISKNEIFSLYNGDQAIAPNKPLAVATHRVNVGDIASLEEYHQNAQKVIYDPRTAPHSEQKGQAVVKEYLPFLGDYLTQATNNAKEDQTLFNQAINRFFFHTIKEKLLNYEQNQNHPQLLLSIKRLMQLPVDQKLFTPDEAKLYETCQRVQALSKHDPQLQSTMAPHILTLKEQVLILTPPFEQTKFNELKAKLAELTKITEQETANIQLILTPKNEEPLDLFALSSLSSQKSYLEHEIKAIQQELHQMEKLDNMPNDFFDVQKHAFNLKASLQNPNWFKAISMVKKLKTKEIEHLKAEINKNQSLYALIQTKEHKSLLDHALSFKLLDLIQTQSTQLTKLEAKEGVSYTSIDDIDQKKNKLLTGPLADIAEQIKSFGESDSSERVLINRYAKTVLDIAEELKKTFTSLEDIDKALVKSDQVEDLKRNLHVFNLVKDKLLELKNIQAELGKNNPTKLMALAVTTDDALAARLKGVAALDQKELTSILRLATNHESIGLSEKLEKQISRMDQKHRLFSLRWFDIQFAAENNTGRDKLYTFMATETDRNNLLKYADISERFLITYHRYVEDMTDALVSQDKQLFERIPATEFLTYDPIHPENTPNLFSFIQHNEAVTNYILKDILSCATPAERSLAIEYWINVAEKSLHHYQLNSQNTAKVITETITNLINHGIMLSLNDISPDAKIKFENLFNQLLHPNSHLTKKVFVESHPNTIPDYELYLDDLNTIKSQATTATFQQQFDYYAPAYDYALKIKEQSQFISSLPFAEKEFPDLANMATPIFVITEGNQFAFNFDNVFMQMLYQSLEKNYRERDGLTTTKIETHIQNVTDENLNKLHELYDNPSVKQINETKKLSRENALFDINNTIREEVLKELKVITGIEHLGVSSDPSHNLTIMQSIEDKVKREIGSTIELHDAVLHTDKKSVAVEKKIHQELNAINKAKPHFIKKNPPKELALLTDKYILVDNQTIHLVPFLKQLEIENVIYYTTDDKTIPIPDKNTVISNYNAAQNTTISPDEVIHLSNPNEIISPSFAALLSFALPMQLVETNPILQKNEMEMKQLYLKDFCNHDIGNLLKFLSSPSPTDPTKHLFENLLPEFLTPQFLNGFIIQDNQALIKLLSTPDPLSDNKQSLFENLPLALKETLQKQLLFFPHKPTENELARYLPNNMSDPRYEFASEKQGGKNKPGAAGGVYVINYSYIENGKLHQNKEKKILFKQDTGKHPITRHEKIHHDKNIAEFITGNIMNELVGNSAASIMLATRPGQSINLPDETGENIYVGSVFYDQFTEIFKLIEFDTPLEDRKALMEFFLSKKIKEALTDETPDPDTGLLQSKYQGFDKISIASLLTGDFDIHTGNAGINVDYVKLTEKYKELKNRYEDFSKKPKQDEQTKLILADLDKRMKEIAQQISQAMLHKIDHAGGLAHLENDVHVHSHRRHNPLHGPANHFRDFPREFIVNPRYAVELERQANINLNANIHKSMEKIAEYYGPRPIAMFAKRSGMDVSRYLARLAVEEKKPDSPQKAAAIKQIKTELVNETTNFLKIKMDLRQQSLKELAMEIKLSNCIDKQREFKAVHFKDRVSGKEINYNIHSLIQENPTYFLKGNFHLRGEDQATVLAGRRLHSVGKQKKLIKMIHNEVDKQLPGLIQNAVQQNDPRIIEHILANKRLRVQCDPSDLNLKYKAMLENIAQNFKHIHLAILNEAGNNNTLLDTLKHHVQTNLAHKIAEEILSEKNISNRTLIVERWVKLKELANAKGDTLTASAIHKALTETPVSELKLTKESLTPKSREHFATPPAPKVNLTLPETPPPIKAMPFLFADQKDLYTQLTEKPAQEPVRDAKVNQMAAKELEASARISDITKDKKVLSAIEIDKEAPLTAAHSRFHLPLFKRKAEDPLVELPKSSAEEEKYIAKAQALKTLATNLDVMLTMFEQYLQQEKLLPVEAKNDTQFANAPVAEDKKKAGTSDFKKFSQFPIFKRHIDHKDRKAPEVDIQQKKAKT